MLRRGAFLMMLSTLLACGVSRDKYDAALAEANTHRVERDRLRAELQTKEAELVSQKGALDHAEAQRRQDAATQAELDELRKQKAAVEARAKLFDEFTKKFRKMLDAGKLDIQVRRGQVVLVLANDVLFDAGRTEIKPEGKAALSDLADALKTVTGRHFLVSGHTDNFPIANKTFPSNWELSAERGVVVVRYLTSLGVNPATLTAAGHAEFDPVHNNLAEEGRAKNRRIEITLQPNIEELVALPELRPRTPSADGERPDVKPDGKSDGKSDGKPDTAMKPEGAAGAGAKRPEGGKPKDKAADRAADKKKDEAGKKKKGKRDNDEANKASDKKKKGKKER
jgi:chemotaxis protein MotB